MASKSLNLLLISALATVAIGLVAFNSGALDPYLSSGKSGTGAGDNGQQEVASAPTEPAGSENAAEPGGTEETPGGDAVVKSEVTPPRFDVVRVESDGNVVIAGNASAGSLVEVITGAQTLGSAKAGPEGDFAVLLADPLAPGDYTIVLRATTPDNVVAMSSETAIISIPETKSGDVLAIVDEPGKPSKLITVPEANEAGDAAQAEGEGETKVAVAAAEPAGETPEKTDPAIADTAGSDEAASENVESAAAADAPQAVGEEEADGAAAGSEAATPEAIDAASGDDAGDETQEQVAAATPKPDESVPAVQFSIAVEAVEIEGDHVFVAGTANPDKIVRVYANRDLIGETRSSEAGRFLVESSRGLAVGEYIIRADMLEVGSADVIARAAVPFEREAGESIAAVAPKEENADNVTANGSGDATAAPEKPADAGTQVAEAGETPAANEPVAGEPAVDTDVANGGQASGSAEEDNAEAGSVNAGDGISKTEPEPAAIEPAETAPAAEKAGTEVAATEPGTIEYPKFDDDVLLTAPKLEKTSGSVIIRRGDTLWQISRRVYGRGVRYTTIYTANKDQIKSPHRIWPGQVFDVPGESQEGDKADLGAIADQNPGNAEAPQAE